MNIKTLIVVTVNTVESTPTTVTVIQTAPVTIQTNKHYHSSIRFIHIKHPVRTET